MVQAHLAPEHYVVLLLLGQQLVLLRHPAAEALYCLDQLLLPVTHPAAGSK